MLSLQELHPLPSKWALPRMHLGAFSAPSSQLPLGMALACREGHQRYHMHPPNPKISFLDQPLINALRFLNLCDETVTGIPQGLVLSQLHFSILLNSYLLNIYTLPIMRIIMHDMLFTKTQ